MVEVTPKLQVEAPDMKELLDWKDIEKGTVLRIKVTLLVPCFNWIKFEIFAFRLRNYGGWNLQPVAIGRTHKPIGDIKDDDFPSEYRLAGDSFSVPADTKDNVDLWG